MLVLCGWVRRWRGDKRHQSGPWVGLFLFAIFKIMFRFFLFPNKVSTTSHWDRSQTVQDGYRLRVDGQLEVKEDSSCTLSVPYLSHNHSIIGLVGKSCVGVTRFMGFFGCGFCQELQAGCNAIRCLSPESLANLPQLSIFDLRDNRLEQLPDEISLLQALERLDLTNNSLSRLVS